MNGHDPEQSVAKLLKLSGERDAPSTERMAQARMAAQESWQRMLAQNKKIIWRRSWLKFSFAIAAGLVGLLVVSPHVASPPAIVAHVTAVEGDASFITGDDIHVGQQLVTANSRVALALGSALSLRVDQHTKLRIDTADHVTLLQGRVYVDSGGLNARAELSIATLAGEVKHLGTQFQVYVQGDTTQVRVREGRVQLLTHDASVEHIAAGEELQVVGSQAVLHKGLSAYGADWEWATAIVPVLDIENRPLAEFLTWMAREHGWQLHYASESLQQHANDIRLHGSFEHMSSSDMIERMSLVTGVPIASREGVLLVGNNNKNNKADQ